MQAYKNAITIDRMQTATLNKYKIVMATSYVGHRRGEAALWNNNIKLLNLTFQHLWTERRQG